MTTILSGSLQEGELAGEPVLKVTKLYEFTEGEALALYAAAMSSAAVNKRWGHEEDPDMISARLKLLSGLEFPEELDTLLAAIGLRVTGFNPKKPQGEEPATICRTPE